MFRAVVPVMCRLRVVGPMATGMRGKLGSGIRDGKVSWCLVMVFLRFGPDAFAGHEGAVDVADGGVRPSGSVPVAGAGLPEAAQFLGHFRAELD